MLLPRQFHVTVVENNNEAEIRRAAWLFPLYLVLINLFVVPIALAGLLTFPPGRSTATCSCWRCRSQAGSDLFTIAAFIGGLSAATAMVIVESVALAIMVSNDIVMPLVLQRREALISGRDDVGALLLTVRRIAIFAILLLAYLYYRSAGDAQLASIGLLSFAAIAQLAPAFFGGLIWRRGTARGAHRRHDGRHSGLGLYAAAAELRRRRHRRPAASSADGPCGLTLLRPQALFGLDLPPLVHGVIWSLALNVLAYVGFSLAPRAVLDRTAAGRPVRALRPDADRAELPALALLGDGRGADHHGRALSRRGAHAHARSTASPPTRGISLDPKAEADFQLLRYAEHLLASAIGAASSRLVLSLLLRKRTVSTKAALKLLDDANAAIHYNREILQTALDHVRQGIAVFDKDLQLICWNRQFGEILDLPPQPDPRRHRARRHPALQRRARRTRPTTTPTSSCASGSHATSPSSEPFLERFAERDLVIEVRANRMPDGGIVTTFTDITPSVEGGRGARARQRDRWSGACASAPRS